MSAPIKPFNLSELDEVARLEGALCTNYIVYSDDDAYLLTECITTTEVDALSALGRYQQQGIPLLHLHRVVGTTEFPLNEEHPVMEVCINHMCERA